MNRAPLEPLEPLTLAYSPCPNDTFIFTPWVEGHVPGRSAGRRAVRRHRHAQSDRASSGEPDVVKVSFHALGHLRDRYCLLRSGGALGRGCGPLVVARTPFAREGAGREDRGDSRPADDRGAAGPAVRAELADANITVMPFDQIMPAVCEGTVDAGVIIHESRFTYQRHGLTQIVDLGDWWERETGHAIPLGGILMRRDLGADLDPPHRKRPRRQRRLRVRAHRSRLAHGPPARAGDGRRGDAPAHRAVRQRVHARLRCRRGKRHCTPAGHRRTPRDRSSLTKPCTLT